MQHSCIKKILPIFPFVCFPSIRTWHMFFPHILYSYCFLIIGGYCIQVGDAALSILHFMVSAHSDLDDAGEIVTPTPRVKRILSSLRCLPHIAQVIFRAIFSFLNVEFLLV